MQRLDILLKCNVVINMSSEEVSEFKNIEEWISETWIYNRKKSLVGVLNP